MRFLVDENLPRRFEQRATLVTYDADFAAMLVLGALGFPSVVLFRDQRGRPDDLAQRLLANLDAIEASLAEGAIAVFDPTRVRIRTLPVTPE